MNQIEKDIKNQDRDFINEGYNIGQGQYINEYPFIYPSPSNEIFIIVDLDEIKIPICPQKPSFRFIVKVIEEKRKIYFINRKKGRYNKSIKLYKFNSGRIHNKKTSDNISRKIQVFYIAFIVGFLNKILALLGYEESFLKLDYQFTSKIKNEYIESLKQKKIGEIISNKISKKYKHYNPYHNKLLCEKLENDIVMQRIFNENYLKLFKIFLENKRKVCLKEYGIDTDIVLDDEIKMLDDSLNDEESKNKIYNCIKNKFIV